MQRSLKKTKFRIRRANLTDIRFLFNIYNQNIKNGFFFSKKKINYSDHKIWFAKNISKTLIFICIKKTKIGYIRYDRFNRFDYKVSIAIKNAFRKKGLGKLLLKNTLKKINSDKFKVYAFVKNSNLASKSFFLDCNFKKFKQNAYVLKFQK